MVVSALWIIMSPCVCVCVCAYWLQGELLLFVVQVGQSVEAQGHAEGVDVLLQGLVLVMQAPGRFQQLVQVVLRLLDGALHLGGQERVFQKHTGGCALEKLLVVVPGHYVLYWKQNKDWNCIYFIFTMQGSYTFWLMDFHDFKPNFHDHASFTQLVNVSSPVLNMSNVSPPHRGANTV